MNPSLDSLPDVLKPSTEVPALLRMSRNAVYAAIREGEIPSVKIGRRILVPKAAIIRMLNGGRGE